MNRAYPASDAGLPHAAHARCSLIALARRSRRRRQRLRAAEPRTHDRPQRPGAPRRSQPGVVCLHGRAHARRTAITSSCGTPPRRASGASASPARAPTSGAPGTGSRRSVSSGNRALWVRYAGGNTRDWQLMTATTTQKTPKQLRFVAQDVDLPSPFVIGDSTGGLGIPYAAGKEVVLLGANGVAVFKVTRTGKDRARDGGQGPWRSSGRGAARDGRGRAVLGQTAPSRRSIRTRPER